MKYPIILTLFLYLNILTAFHFAAPPANYYTPLHGKSAAALKTALHDILMQDSTRYLAYGEGVNATWHGFYSTDRDTLNNLVLDYLPNNSFTFSEIALPSALPANWRVATPITLPMSCGPAAPTSAMIAAMIVSSSASDI